MKVSNYYNNNYIEFESNSDRNKILSVEEFINKIKLEAQMCINQLTAYCKCCKSLIPST